MSAFLRCHPDRSLGASQPMRSGGTAAKSPAQTNKRIYENRSVLAVS
jgi:hypothetical protein